MTCGADAAAQPAPRSDSERGGQGLRRIGHPKRESGDGNRESSHSRFPFPAPWAYFYVYQDETGYVVLQGYPAAFTWRRHDAIRLGQQNPQDRLAEQWAFG